jgi:hypothetical protein
MSDARIPPPHSAAVPSDGAPQVLAPDGIRPGSPVPSSPVPNSTVPDPAGQDGERSTDAGGVDRGEIESPAKIIRIGAMVKQMLEEVRSTSIDDAARDQLRRIHDNSIQELKAAMSEDLGEELDTLTFDFSGDQPPSEAELRMAQAQLVGWLEGLFHGIQATLVAQQMAARQQLEGMRAQLPEGPGSPGHGPGYI